MAQRKGKWQCIFTAFVFTLFSAVCFRSDATHSRVVYHPKDFQFPVLVGINLGGQTYQVKGEVVTSSFFTTRDCRPYLGRVFRTDDYRPVVVLRYQLWQRLYGSDLTVIGKKLNISGRPFVVVGVTPPSFTVPSGADLWILPFHALWDPSRSGDQADGLTRSITNRTSSAGGDATCEQRM